MSICVAWPYGGVRDCRGREYRNLGSITQLWKRVHSIFFQQEVGRGGVSRLLSEVKIILK